jgi:hypothetical protein
MLVRLLYASRAVDNTQPAVQAISNRPGATTRTAA